MIVEFLLKISDLGHSTKCLVKTEMLSIALPGEAGL
jgi:hypothetical protein